MRSSDGSHSAAPTKLGIFTRDRWLHPNPKRGAGSHAATHRRRPIVPVPRPAAGSLGGASPAAGGQRGEPPLVTQSRCLVLLWPGHSTRTPRPELRVAYWPCASTGSVLAGVVFKLVSLTIAPPRPRPGRPPPHGYHRHLPGRPLLPLPHPGEPRRLSGLAARLIAGVTKPARARARRSSHGRVAHPSAPAPGILSARDQSLPPAAGAPHPSPAPGGRAPSPHCKFPHLLLFSLQSAHAIEAPWLAT
jgi:hypothetical protein